MGSSDLAVGDRVAVGGPSELVGVVGFLGPTQFAEGEWVGVELDAPEGKNDGSIRGVKYFKCKEKHGVFVRPTGVQKKDASDAASPGEGPATEGASEGNEAAPITFAGASPSPSALQAAAAAYEAEWAQRFEEQQSLIRDMQQARTAVARVAENVREARLCAEDAERTSAATISPEAFGMSVGAQLERRVLAGLDSRLAGVIQGAADAAVGEAFALATQNLAVAIAELRQRRARRRSVEGMRQPGSGPTRSRQNG